MVQLKQFSSMTLRFSVYSPLPYDDITQSFARPQMTVGIDVTYLEILSRFMKQSKLREFILLYSFLLFRSLQSFGIASRNNAPAKLSFHIISGLLSNLSSRFCNIPVLHKGCRVVFL